MKLRLGPMTVQEDRLRSDPALPDERVLVSWKRVVARGEAEREGASARFEVVLDMRAAILTTRLVEGALPAARIADVLVAAMVAQTALPASRVFVERLATERLAEWIALDPIHASGLLHRVKEVDAAEGARRPWPPQLAPTMGVIFASVEGNLAAMETIHADALGDRVPASRRPLDLAAWDAQRGLFLDLVDDAPLRVAATRFFDLSRRYERAAEALWIGGIAHTLPSGEAADHQHAASRIAREEILGGMHEEAVDAGRRVLAARPSHTSTAKASRPAARSTGSETL